ncbi:uncharacterized protein LOC112147338 [Oryzias melastigma]|uniref:uncharacterized protein LOC112147338 n=1 Tax=Oryzias melastigma TaxID=30732 RepID=UPI000CF7E855|nr:uncharacterized protein LOC112147338 [Oryzias melastigma]XP_024129419.1 uncharacterized protein LOC112147338 [Oryzias melastigma]XP_024129420.1 uncharacterized protein LOC112147338 [Oryzias melastigma]
MRLRHSSKLMEGFPKSPIPKNKAINYSLRSQRWNPSLEKTQSYDHKTDSEHDQDENSDVPSISDEEGVGKSGSPSESADPELDGSSEACWSDCSSVASGPSFRRYAALREPVLSQSVCSTCRKLYQRARSMKGPITDRLYDNDPSSLTCDHWILIKKIKPKKLTPTKRIESLKLEQRECGERESPTCSRPHIFLQRNLRRCIKKPSRKVGKKRKRRRYNTKNSSVAKKQHFQKSNPDRNVGSVDANDCADNSFCSGFGWADCSGQSVDHEAALDVTMKEMPSTVSPETSDFKQKAEKKEPKTKTSFKDLLTQCLYNSSGVITRERH